MNMEEAINEFEKLIILKTIVFDVIDAKEVEIRDLEKIEGYAYDMKIELPEADLDELYNFQFSKIEEIYIRWRDYVLEKYEEIKEELLE